MKDWQQEDQRLEISSGFHYEAKTWSGLEHAKCTEEGMNTSEIAKYQEFTFRSAKAPNQVCSHVPQRQDLALCSWLLCDMTTSGVNTAIRTVISLISS